MNVLVIPEDFRKDQYVLRPIIEALLAKVGRPRARVTVLKDPVLGGVTEALKWERIEPILRRYQGMVDLFLLIVDQDGKPGRRNQLSSLEHRAQAALPHAQFFADMAIEEVEVWILAGHDLLKGWAWAGVRSHVNPKEAYFAPLAAGRDLLDEPGEGRKTLSLEAAKRYGRVRSLCPDLKDLESRIAALL